MMTAEQKSSAIATLSRPYGSAKFKATKNSMDYQITASVEPVRAMQYRVMIYVDGFVRAEWLMSDSAHPQTAFMRRSTKKLHTKKEIDLIRKGCGKKMADKAAAKIFIWYHPDFASGTRAINHLLRAADDLILLSIY